MAKIICITTGLTGILNASLELVERLKASGHEVSYASPRDVGSRLELHNIPFEKLPKIKLKYDTDVPEFKGLFRKPYLLHDTIPGKGWKGNSAAIYFSWKIVQLKRWLTFSWQKFYTISNNRRSVLLRFAEQENFPLKWLKENYWPGPFSYDALPVISMTAQEMEFPHDPRPNHFYVGAMVNENRIDKLEKSNNGFSIEEVFDYQKKIGGKLIYCSVSTLLQGDLNFIKKIILAVRRNKNWILIIGMGGLINEETLGVLPGNIFAFSYVPQLKVLAKADLSINHGGIHTINECVFFKVPMLIYSGKKSDQNGCAARVDFHNLGIMADKDIDSPEQIRAKINQVLTDKLYQENIEQMNQVFQKYKNEKTLEKIIEENLKIKLTSNKK